MRASRRSLLFAAAAAAVTFSIALPGPVQLRARPMAASKGKQVLVTVLAPKSSGTHVEAAPREVTTVGKAATKAIAQVQSGEASKIVPVPPAGSVGPSVRTVYAEKDGPLDAPEPPDSGVCAKAATCPDFQLRSAHWPLDPTGAVHINWKFNDQGRRNLRAPAGLLETAVRNGMSEWSKWNSNIVFNYAGTTTSEFGAMGKDGTCADGTNTITWDHFDPEIIAVAGVCTDNAGRIVRDADLALNVTYHWENIHGKPDSRHSFDIGSIVTHELGHWLGLLDLYSPADVHQTMSGFSEYGDVNKRTPALGDIMGIQKEFPCDANDRCPRSGIADD